MVSAGRLEFSALLIRLIERAGEKSGRLTSDPNRSSLGLLPSGPDPVGEWSVHCQPPGLYIGRTKGESKRSRLWETGQKLGFSPWPGHDGPMSEAQSFSLHRQLAADSHTVGDLPLSRVLIIKDANFPWVLLVPRRSAVSEIIDLAPAEQTALMGEIARTGAALKEITACDKLNIAALGNVVPQLHVHLIARSKTDPTWPHPVWGRLKPKAYDARTLDQFTKLLARALNIE